MKELIKTAEAFMRAHVAATFPRTLTFHSIEHIAGVADAAKALGKQAGLNEEDAACLRLAAWFHDAGFHAGAQEHEERGATIAEDFLKAQGVDAPVVDRVRTLILATRADAVPATELERMLRDADLSHCATKEYPEWLERLRQEIEAAQGERPKKKAWLVENIAFLEAGPFTTEAAMALWGPGLTKNLAALREELKERDARKEEKTSAEETERVEKEARKKLKETERGVETMFRVTLSNHTRLSQIADNKANMMLSVNGLMVTVLLSGLGSKLDTNTELILPAAMLTITCLLSILTATLATRPKVTKGNSTREEIVNRNANLLFFGNFHSMAYEDFKWGMQQVMNDRSYLYGSMTKDLYFLGKVLHKKYYYLNITYMVFATGLLLSVASGIYAFDHMPDPAEAGQAATVVTDSVFAKP